MEFKTIALPTTRIQLAKLIADNFESFGLSCTDAKIKSRGNYHQITLRSNERCSDFQIKVGNNDIIITNGKEIWEMFTLDRQNNTATTFDGEVNNSLIREMLICVLTGTESRIHKIYDIAEALAELYSQDPMSWDFNHKGNLSGWMTINGIELTLDFDHLNRFAWGMSYFDQEEMDYESIDSSAEMSDNWFGDALWLCDGTYNYMATGFNACKTWQKLTKDLEFAVAHLMSTRK